MDYSAAVSTRNPGHVDRLLSRTPTHESAPFAAVQTDESLVADTRAGVTPAQMVERKLVSLLKSNPTPVSHLMTGRVKSRLLPRA